MSRNNEGIVDEMVQRNGKKLRFCPNGCLQSVAGLLMMAVCVVVLAWTKNKLEIPTYRNQNPAALYLADLFKQKTTTMAPSSSVVKVLLVTYNRGGSTFLGETFNQNSEAFYWFEPLAAVYEAKYGNAAHNIISILPDDSYFSRDFSAKDREKTLNVFHQIFECSLTSLPSVIYTHRFMTKGAWMKSTKMQSYKNCLNNKRNRRDTDKKNGYLLTNESLPEHTQSCIPYLTRECSESSVRAIKTIRLRMNMVTDILDKDPDIKVLYLMRDPRGILASRHKTHQHDEVYNLDKIREASTHLCQIMRKDKKELRELLNHHPKSFLKLKYEDLAERPLQTTVRMYRFLGLDPSEQVLEAMHSLTHSDSASSGGASTRRVNGTATALSWMTDLPNDILVDIQKNCEDILKVNEYLFL